MLIVDHEVVEIQQRMLQRAIERLVAAGKPVHEAQQMAAAALHAPSSFRIPALDELDG